jgi:glycosyltransferase involved in cell wall biosynthesis
MATEASPIAATLAHPFASVIVPVFQDQAGIERCLEALARQSYPRDCYEVIVVDNGSVPPIQLTGAGALRLRCLRCETPGAYAARNAGISHATGEVLAFTDADCLPEPGWLAAGVAALRERPSAAVGGEVALLQPRVRTGTSLYQYEWGFRQRENIRGNGFSATANLFCLRGTMQSVGGFDQRLLSGADREWAWRAARTGVGMAYCADAVVVTSPRTTLRGAIRQARRVAAGRRDLLRHGLAPPEAPATGGRNSLRARLRWIATRPGLSPWERVRVLCAAVAIRLAVAAEGVRLGMGGRAERR